MEEERDDHIEPALEHLVHERAEVDERAVLAAVELRPGHEKLEQRRDEARVRDHRREQRAVVEPSERRARAIAGEGGLVLGLDLAGCEHLERGRAEDLAEQLEPLAGALDVEPLHLEAAALDIERGGGHPLPPTIQFSGLDSTRRMGQTVSPRAEPKLAVGMPSIQALSVEILVAPLLSMNMNGTTPSPFSAPLSAPCKAESLAFSLEKPLSVTFARARHSFVAYRQTVPSAPISSVNAGPSGVISTDTS